MRSGCISHPTGEPLVLIRTWQLKACGGNGAAAALLSFLEYWHNIRIDQSGRAGDANRTAQEGGDEGHQDESLFQYHNTKQLEEGVLIYKADAIRAGLQVLVSLGFVTVHKNPNPRYSFDKTRFFLLDTKAVNNWIRESELEPVPAPERKKRDVVTTHPGGIEFGNVEQAVLIITDMGMRYSMGTVSPNWKTSFQKVLLFLTEEKATKEQVMEFGNKFPDWVDAPGAVPTPNQIMDYWNQVMAYDPKLDSRKNKTKEKKNGEVNKRGLSPVSEYKGTTSRRRGRGRGSETAKA